jgi:hypothetical protein
MKRLFLVFCFLVSCNLVFLDSLWAQEQRELIYGSAATPVSLDTVYGTTVDSATSISRQITFKGPKSGFISIYGKLRVIAGSDTAFTVWYRELGSVYDSPAIWSQYDSLGAIADGDTTFFFSVATPSSFKESDGIEFKFVMDTTGTRTIEIKAITKIK